MVTPKNRIVFLILVSFLPSLLFSAKTTNKDVDNLANDIAGIESIIRHNNTKKNGILDDLQALNHEIAGSERIIRIILFEEKVTDQELANLKTELSSLEKEVVQVQKLYQKIILEEYKYRDYKSKLFFLVSSKNINQFLIRFRQLERLKEFRVKHLKVILRKKENLRNKILVYEGSEEDKQKIIAQKQKARSELKFLIEEKKVLLRDVQKENNMLQMRLNESKARLKRIESKVVESMDEDSDIKEELSEAFRIDWPVDRGLIVGKFGIQNHTTIHKIKIENNGVDILVPENEAVYCVLPGKVRAVFEIPGYNSSIIVNHGNFISVYSNVKDPLIREGSIVNHKTQLATIARNEENLFQLHFELWKGIKKVDPEKFLKER